MNVNEETQEPTNELNREAIQICKSIGSEATTVDEAIKCEKVKQHIQQAVDKYNEQATSRAQKVQKWIILQKDFSIPGGEIGKWYSDMTNSTLNCRLPSSSLVVREWNWRKFGTIVGLEFPVT